MKKIKHFILMGLICFCAQVFAKPETIQVVITSAGGIKNIPTIVLTITGTKIQRMEPTSCEEVLGTDSLKGFLFFFEIESQWLIGKAGELEAIFHTRLNRQDGGDNFHTVRLSRGQTKPVSMVNGERSYDVVVTHLKGLKASESERLTYTPQHKAPSRQARTMTGPQSEPRPSAKARLGQKLVHYKSAAVRKLFTDDDEKSGHDEGGTYDVPGTSGTHDELSHI